jgi:hypothetical protein
VTLLSSGDAIAVEVIGRTQLPQGQFSLVGLAPHDHLDATVLGGVWRSGEGFSASIGDHRVSWLHDRDRAFGVAPRDPTLRWGGAGLDLSLAPVDDGWDFFHGAEVHRFVPPAEGTPFGVIRHPRFGPAVLVLAGDHHAVLAITPQGEHVVVHRSTAAVVDAVAHDRQPVLGLRTESGGVTAVSWRTGQVLYRHMVVPP